ncbi:riboflavin synthase [Candidatus Pacearchaeota archaeon]|nr:riboflavin synthase [Candidatus Pacearchaeota archaeon]
MFTGIIETVGRIQSITDQNLTIEASEIIADLKKGSSVTVDGACLTVTDLSGDTFSADFMPETAQKTIILGCNVDDLVNLELPMRADGRFEGHMVTGHVEGLGEIVTIKSDGNAHILTIRAPSNLKKYITQKGSIAINGISLTIAMIEDDQFSVHIIPHTWEITNLHNLDVGDKVNLETDILAKHLEKLIQS